MPRKPSKPAPKNIPDGIPPGHAVSVQEAETLNRLQAGYTEGRDLANQLMARVQLAHGFSKIGDVSALLDLQRIKENKLYRALSDKPLQMPDGKVVTVTTWADFCASIGVSREKVDEDLRNLAAFGEEAIASMHRAGLGYRDLRKLRALPEGDRIAIVNDIEVDTGDKEAIVSLIDDMAVKHAGEKQALQSQVNDLQGDLDAQRQLNEKKNTKIDKLTADLHKRDNIPADERGTDLSARLEERTMDALNALLALEVVVREATEWEDRPSYITDMRPQCCNRVRTRLDEIQEYYGAWEDLSHDPSEDGWMDEVGSKRPSVQ